MTARTVHTGLTLEDVDTINGCRQRLLSALALLELGLNHMDDDQTTEEEIQIALLDLVDRLRADVTLINVTIVQAEQRPVSRLVDEAIEASALLETSRSQAKVKKAGSAR